MDLLRKKYQQIQSESDIHSRDLVKLNETLEAKQAEIRTLESKFSEGKKHYEASRDGIESGKKEKEKIDEEIKKVNHEIEELHQKIEEFNKQAEAKKTELGRLNESQKVISQKSDDERKSFESGHYAVQVEQDHVNEMRSALSHLREQVAKKEQVHTTFEHSLAQIEHEMLLLGKDIKKMQTELER